MLRIPVQLILKPLMNSLKMNNSIINLNITKKKVKGIKVPSDAMQYRYITPPMLT